MMYFKILLASIRSFVFFSLINFSLNFIQFYEYWVNKRTKKTVYVEKFSCSFLWFYAAFFFILGPTIQMTGRIPTSFFHGGVWMVALLVFLELMTIVIIALLLLSNKVFSFDIYIIQPADMIKLIQKTLEEMGWKDIHLELLNKESLSFSDPNEKCTILSKMNQDRITIQIRSIFRKIQFRPKFEINFRDLLLKNIAENRALIDPELVALFKKKYHWIYVLSWIVLIALFLSFIVYMCIGLTLHQY